MLLGGCGFAISHRFRESLDVALSGKVVHLFTQLRAAFSPAPAPDEDLLLCGRLISSLQAGISLDAAIDAAACEAHGTLRARLRVLLDGRPRSDFLSGFLRSALDSGTPVLASLQNLEKALRARRKLALRANAASGNCRAQAEVLSWLPWVLAAGIAVVDTEWFSSAAHLALSWFLWGLAVLLAGGGRAWIRSAVAKALSPRGAEEHLEEAVLPDFVLRIIAEVSRGIDVESATEQSLHAVANPKLSRAFLSAAGGPRVSRLRSSLAHASRTGAPVREELTAFLHDLQSDLESRWEERVQRLPIALLGPLFICFFPSSLLVLAGLLVPILRMNL